MILARLLAQHGRGAIVGPHGSGKTTFMDALDVALTARGYRVFRRQLHADDRGTRFGPARPGPNDALLLDSAGWLSMLAWQRFRWRTRAAGVILITAHRAGRLATLHRTTTSPALLRSLAETLTPNLDHIDFDTLFDAHGGNIRHAFRDLYDQFARLPDAASSPPPPSADVVHCTALRRTTC